MDVFEYASELHYGELHLCHDPQTGLRAIIALHNLNLGPAIGGCRFIEYPNSNAAIRDAMRLARGMSYKAAITGLPHGGGKSVIVKPGGFDNSKREALFRRFGEFVDTIGGRYLTAEDSGTSVADMNTIKTATDHVLGYDPGVGSSGDPSPFTAYGVLRGIEAAVKHQLGRDDLDGLRVSIQGVGNVGYHLAKHLDELGARLVVTDIDTAAVTRCVNEFGAQAVAPDAIFDVEVDVFAPCALGAILDDDTIARLRCRVVAGAANNQLAEPRHGAMLKERNILYAPDYAINAGGLVSVAQEVAGYDVDKVRTKTGQIYDTMLEIFERADAEGLPTNVVANRVAEERFLGAPLS